MEDVNIQKVFGVVLRLERVIEREKRTLTNRKVGELSRYQVLKSHCELAQTMRKTANRLQLQCAAGNKLGALHEVRIFEGLTSLIEPTIVPQLVPSGYTEGGSQIDYH